MKSRIFLKLFAYTIGIFKNRYKNIITYDTALRNNLFRAKEASNQ